ncbi:MAG: GvpL/GvpF family gas vesicle protein [Chloroflexi bacterium]|nr:GvpL/GvpF family gas vesicle protein [Chloroflexota bacterium]
MARLLYLYCVLPDDEAVIRLLDSAQVRGIEPSHPVFALKEDGLLAAVSFVPGEKFQEATLNQITSSLSELTPYAVRHHEVVQSLFQAAPSIVPIALGAVYRSEENVRSMLRARKSEFAPLLRKLHGKQEWDLKVFRQSNLLARAVETKSKRLQTMSAEAARATPGRSYLISKQREQAVDAEIESFVNTTFDAIVDRMRPHAEDLRVERFPITDPEGSRLAFKASFLLDTSRAAEFRKEADAVAAEHAGNGLEIAVAGPWPPYSFAGRGTKGARG